MLVSRNVTVHGRRTSMRLEPEMWDALEEICRRERLSLHELTTAVATERDQQPDPDASLTAFLRVYIVRYYRAACTETGHQRAGHGRFRG